MAIGGPEGAPNGPVLTSLPRIEDIPLAGEGYDPDRTREAFESFRRVAAQLQAQLRVLQAAGRGASIEPTGHAVRMDALHLIRAAAEFADTLERDAQRAASSQLARTEEEVRHRQEELKGRENEAERYRLESERQRAEILTAARNEAREILGNANRDASQELREAEAKAARMLEQARHSGTELTNSARAEVEQTLEWARAQASTIMARAQQGAEQFLAAAGLGEPAIAQVAEAIVRAANESSEAARHPAPEPPSRPTETFGAGPVARPAPARVAEPEPAPEPQAVVEEPEAKDEAQADGEGSEPSA
jgi:hypothetical protein